MRRTKWWLVALGASVVAGCGGAGGPVLDAPGPGAYAVASTHLEVAPRFAELSRDDMHAYLLGRPTDDGEQRYLLDLLRHPEAAWVVQVEVPEDPVAYGSASATTLPVVSVVTYPTDAQTPRQPYPFPYEGARYGGFDHMLAPGEAPAIAADQERFPLILLAHGLYAHGLYDVDRAQRLASHGYIVAVLNYGDERTVSGPEHQAYLRPLITKAVLDSLLRSETFGPRIDADNIGMAGHSFGGFSTLAVAGGRFRANPASVTDPRITAGAVTAPWVGGDRNEQGDEVPAFGADNQGLADITIPILCQYGTRDEATRAKHILPAMRQLGGPRYVVTMFDQPHIFDAGGWQDRDHWELLFFAAHLKGDAEALEALAVGASMAGGGRDRQRFDDQRLPP